METKVFFDRIYYYEGFMIEVFKIVSGIPKPDFCRRFKNRKVCKAYFDLLTN